MRKLIGVVVAAGLAAIGLGFWLGSASQSATEISSVPTPTTVSQISISEIHNLAHLEFLQSNTRRGGSSEISEAAASLIHPSAACFICSGHWSPWEGSVMRNDYLRDPHKFDRWLKANAVLGSLLAIGMLAMALAGRNLAAQPDGATELSSITSLK
jgi:hypothetical protein